MSWNKGLSIYNIGYLGQSNDLFEITQKGKDYLISNNKNPENKGLRIWMLEYLKQNKAYTQKTDVVSPFLREAASLERRRELLQTLNYLSEVANLKVSDDTVYYLAGKRDGQMPGIYQTKVKASIIENGERLIVSLKETPP